MTYHDEQGRPKPPVTDDEVATLLGFLDFQRATLAWKCAGLGAAGLAARIATSTMSLGGLLKHLAHIEADMFDGWLHGRDLGAPWNTVDWDARPDWAWTSAADDSPEQLYTLWQTAVDRSRATVAQALAAGGLEQPAAGITNAHGQAPNLRYLLLQLSEEYARHTGHADLLREAVDGLTGE